MGRGYNTADASTQPAAGPAAHAPSRQTLHLPAGSCRCPDYRRDDPCPYPRSLLASHFLECTVTASPEPLLVVILGPTGSGKTALSLSLAERFGGEIVNCDSVAMYRELEIGTAKPSA